MSEITRRDFVRGAVAAGLLGAAGAGAQQGKKKGGKKGAFRPLARKPAPPAMVPGKRPNILLIHCDQQRYDSLGHTGHPLVKTPNLDRLAAEGIRFDRAYTPIPTCCPERQCLLSGKWAENHGGYWNYDITLPTRPFDEHTWTEDLHAAGYRMGYVGKWHVHPTKTPLDFGFEDTVTDGDYRKWRQAQGIAPTGTQGKPKAGKDWFGGVDQAPVEKTHTHYLAAQAVELIRRYNAEGKPWHVRLDHIEPHLPCYPAQQFIDMYDPAAIKPWSNFPDPFTNKPYIQKQLLVNWELEGLTWDDWRVYVQRYLAMVSQLDDAIGLVLKGLKDLGLEENTLVIFTADHGDACGGHGMIDKHYCLYEDTTHVPLLMRWPGVIKPGSRCDEFVIHALDLAATLPGLAGVPFASEGRTLLPLMQGQTPPDWRRYAFSTHNGAQFGLYTMRMIRDKRWKYIWNPTDTDELYDLQTDPAEMENKVAHPECAEPLARLRKDLAADLTARGDRLLNTWTIRQLAENRKLPR